MFTPGRLWDRQLNVFLSLWFLWLILSPFVSRLWINVCIMLLSLPEFIRSNSPYFKVFNILPFVTESHIFCTYICFLVISFRTISHINVLRLISQRYNAVMWSTAWMYFSFVWIFRHRVDWSKPAAPDWRPLNHLRVESQFLCLVYSGLCMSPLFKL